LRLRAWNAVRQDAALDALELRRIAAARLGAAEPQGISRRLGCPPPWLSLGPVRRAESSAFLFPPRFQCPSPPLSRPRKQRSRNYFVRLQRAQGCESGV